MKLEVCRKILAFTLIRMLTFGWFGCRDLVNLSMLKSVRYHPYFEANSRDHILLMSSIKLKSYLERDLGKLNRHLGYVNMEFINF